MDRVPLKDGAWARTQARSVLFLSSQWNGEPAAQNGDLLDGMPFIGLLLSFPSLLHSPGVSWDHPPNKPLTFESLPQSLPLGEPKLKRVR